MPPQVKTQEKNVGATRGIPLNNVKPLMRFCGILGTYFSIDMYALTGNPAR
jgi:hypothetical protein